MQVNTAIYGAASSWITSGYTGLGTGNDPVKIANFGNNSSDLAAGNTAGKTPYNELIEGSICFSALGKESLYSRLYYAYDMANPDRTEYIDDEIITPFFYAQCKGFYTDGHDSQDGTFSVIGAYNNNAWKPHNIDSYFTNYSDWTQPIVELSPRKIIYLFKLEVYNAAGVKRATDPLAGEYASNSNMQSNYPYIRFAYLEPRVNTSSTNTPSWSALNIDAAIPKFGICINREFTNSPVSYSKINYAQFRSPVPNYIPVYGITGLSYGDDTTRYTPILADKEDIVYGRDGSYYVFAEHEYSADFIEFLIQQAACFGVFFRVYSDHGSLNGLGLDDSDIYLGVLDSYGVGHGEYTRGAANRDNPIWSWSSYSQSPYDYTKEIPSDYDESSHFNSITLASCNKVWVASYNEVEDLVAELYKGLSAKPIDVYTTDYSVDTYLSTNAIDGILSVRHYPLIRVPCSDTVYPLTIGAYTSNDVTVRKFVNAAGSQFIDFKFSRNKRLNEAFGGSFLDREPYTTAELYIPFCGTVPISIADYIGHDITVKLAIDYKTGSCTAYILKDSTPLQSANGQIGVDIPVSGLQSATLDGQLLNANLALKQSQTSIITGGVGAFTSAVGSVASVVGGGKFGLSQTAGSAGGIVSQIGAVSSAIDRKDVLAYELHHQETPVKTISAGSPTTAAMGELCCRLTIYRPILSADYDAEVYAKTIGFACLINGKVRDFSGLTLGIISLDGVNATAEEKQLIATAFKQGVFL